MPIYQETKPSRLRAIAFLVLAFASLYCPWRVGDMELRWQEGFYASMALESKGSPPVGIVHGRMVANEKPLFPLTASWLKTLLGVNMQHALRLVSIISVAALSIMIWEAARQAGGRLAAAAGVAAFISSLVVVDKALDGYPHFMTMVFLTGGWLAWFRKGAARNNWDAAWTYSLLFAGLAFYTGGFQALLFFFFPLLFMRRPLTVWSKITRKTMRPLVPGLPESEQLSVRGSAPRFGFILGLVALFFFILLWAAPRWLCHLPRLAAEGLDMDDLRGYGGHLLKFPFDTALRFMPWIIFAWAPFCVAFHDIDSTPLFSKYLRTITISLFFLLWLNPFTESRDIVILAPTLAIMIGINYWLVARRHGPTIKKALCFAAYALAVAAIIAFTACVYRLAVPEPFAKTIEFIIGQRFENIGIDTILWVGDNYGHSALYAAFAALMLMVAALAFWDSLRLYECILLLTACAGLMYWGFIYPFRVSESRLDKSKWNQTRIFREALLANGFTPGGTVWLAPNISGFHTRGYYLFCDDGRGHDGGRIRRLESNRDPLPEDAPKVHLISLETPGYPERLWTVIASVPYKNYRIYLWEGTLGDERPNDNDEW